MLARSSATVGVFWIGDLDPLEDGGVVVSRQGDLDRRGGRRGRSDVEDGLAGAVVGRLWSAFGRGTCACPRGWSPVARSSW